MVTTRKFIAPAYDVHPGLEMVRKQIAGLKEKTGRNLEEWTKLAEKEGLATERERREWLKKKHGMGMNYASWIAQCSLGNGEDGNPNTYLKHAEEYVAAMYAGAKEGLRPIYDELLALGRSMGKDVKVCPCQTM